MKPSWSYILVVVLEEPHGLQDKKVCCSMILQRVCSIHIPVLDIKSMCVRMREMQTGVSYNIRMALGRELKELCDADCKRIETYR